MSKGSEAKNAKKGEFQIDIPGIERKEAGRGERKEGRVVKDVRIGYNRGRRRRRMERLVNSEMDRP